MAELCRLAAEELPGSDVSRAVRVSESVPGVVVRVLSERQPVSRRLVLADVSSALSSSLASDAAALGVGADELAAALTPGHDARTGDDAVADGIMAMARRDNLSMGEDARRTWLSAVSRWVPAAARGELSYEECVARVVSECARRGVKVVDYASGRRVSLDVAARRHIVTQVQHAASSRTMSAAESMGEGLVFVTSHVGARPSHREWQGRAYACHGPRVVDGVTYEDLAEATGYGTAGGLCGANCRHSFGPWMHWQEPPYSSTPDEDAGLDPDEAYRATQAQRANERAIRRAKLEAESLRAAGADDSRARLALGRAQASQRRLLRDNSWLRRRPERERAYGDGGRAVDVRPLSRQALTKDAVLDATEGIYRAAGVSRSRVGRALSDAGFDASKATRADAERAVRRAVGGIAREDNAREAHDLIASGEYPLSVRRHKQEEHIMGTDARASRLRRIEDGKPVPSVVHMTVDEAESLIRRCSGTGVGRVYHHKDGSVTLKETCVHPDGAIIGTYIDGRSGMAAETDRFTIHYSKKHGAHIVPSMPLEGVGRNAH